MKNTIEVPYKVAKALDVIVERHGIEKLLRRGLDYIAYTANRRGRDMSSRTHSNEANTIMRYLMDGDRNDLGKRYAEILLNGYIGVRTKEERNKERLDRVIDELTRMNKATADFAESIARPVPRKYHETERVIAILKEMEI